MMSAWEKDKGEERQRARSGGDWGREVELF